jgi:ubiquinol-cytochrome c reductase iron-sulfur subunit
MTDEHTLLLQRRKMLLAATTTVGGIGLIASAIPFIASMEPSEAAKAAGAPVEIDLAQVGPGQLLTSEWRGRPVWIVHRTDAMLDLLGKHDALLADPQSEQDQQPPYARNRFRSIKPAFFVAIGICTHLGCIPLFRPDSGAADLGAAWPGGFYCPCHGSRFDLAGRVFKNVPAPRNLEIPPHQYLSATRLQVGTEQA